MKGSWLLSTTERWAPSPFSQLAKQLIKWSPYHSMNHDLLLRGGSHDFVNSMKWTMDASDANSMIYECTVYLDWELSSNRAELKKL